MTQFVRDVMTPGVVSVRPDSSLVEAAQLMRAQDVGDVAVTVDGRLVGIVTDRDLVVRAIADGVDPLAVSCQSVCTADPVTVAPDDEVTTATTLMRVHAVRRLPVVQGTRPLGFVSLGDIAREQDPDSVLADISRAAPDHWPSTATP